MIIIVTLIVFVVFVTKSVSLLLCPLSPSPLCIFHSLSLFRRVVEGQNRTSLLPSRDRPFQLQSLSWLQLRIHPHRKYLFLLLFTCIVNELSILNYHVLYNSFIIVLTVKTCNRVTENSRTMNLNCRTRKDVEGVLSQPTEYKVYPMRWVLIFSLPFPH